MLFRASLHLMTEADAINGAFKAHKVALLSVWIITLLPCRIFTNSQACRSAYNSAW